eukprot:gnl/MRDRNA2_/MRDRNA2_16056_c0_seq2.p1 gnl/MRDRNA2_/MRDRNA2_16056_c0~~gnl/MRDRNA2_/MRDRNA2_16056_c0_seq2.p1  ORF type:complete len:423 (+),score=87.31 gnl/MRDRNA2_/MRDRNA2_16056_c0_seq2:47-1270(+)
MEADLLFLQEQISQLRTAYARLHEDSEALKECLEASGLLSGQCFLARLHRRRFQGILKHHPLSCKVGLNTVMDSHELALATLQAAGSAAASRLTVVSKGILCKMRGASEAFSQFFPPAMYVLGGLDDVDETLGTVERFDPATGVWAACASLTTPRDCCAAVASGGFVFAVGGFNDNGEPINDVERFDPSSNIWETVTPMRTPRGRVAATLNRGKVYSIGGIDDDGQRLSTVERYDPEINVWEQMVPLQSARAGAAAVALAGRIFVAGGFDGRRCLGSVECFDPDAPHAWQPLAPLQKPRVDATAVAADGALYVVGGMSDGHVGGQLELVERFDLQQGHWEFVAPLGIPRAGAMAVSLRGEVYVLGGRSEDDAALDTVEHLKPVEGQWQRVPSMCGPRAFGAAVVCRA